MSEEAAAHRLKEGLEEEGKGNEVRLLFGHVTVMWIHRGGC